MIKGIFCLCLLLATTAFARPASAVPPRQRLVALTPAITEMLFSLGLGSDIVGESLYSDFPVAAKRIPKIGGTTVNYEKVVALRPTLVIGDGVATPAADKRLAQLHLKVLEIRPLSIDAIEQGLLQIGNATGTSKKAMQVVAHMRATQKQVRLIVQQSQTRPSVLLVVGTDPLYAAGHGTFMNAILEEAGGVNAAKMSGYGTLSPEVVLAHPPDWILADSQDQAALEADPVLRLIAAVHEHRFVSIPADLLQRPGPRVVQGLLDLARALHSGAR